jgi:hypothetical protein
MYMVTVKTHGKFKMQLHRPICVYVHACVYAYT